MEKVRRGAGFRPLAHLSGGEMFGKYDKRCGQLFSVVHVRASERRADRERFGPAHVPPHSDRPQDDVWTTTSHTGADTRDDPLLVAPPEAVTDARSGSIRELRLAVRELNRQQLRHRPSLSARQAAVDCQKERQSGMEELIRCAAGTRICVLPNRPPRAPASVRTRRDQAARTQRVRPSVDRRAHA